ncbi:MAG: agmatinase [Bacteroidales bacterium]|jgi:agmatinase|nr:agmatinase [Bacteroidales bacterium]
MEYFLDMPSRYNSYENASTVLLPVPFDGTSTFVKGADKGPQAIIDASDSIELYDVEEEVEIYTCGIHTAQSVKQLQTVEEMTQEVYLRTNKYILDKKLICLLGGEHSVSLGAIKAVSEIYKPLTVLQLDAHADLRESYHDSKYNHACVMRRAQELAKVVQVGIRNVCIEEKPFIVPQNMFYAHKIYGHKEWMLQAINQLDKNVYLTIDLDCFDPSIVPSTGTPLPGGMLWQDVIEFLSLVIKHKNVVGFDVVELCPNPYDKSSDVLAAVLVYKIITKIMKKNMPLYK